MQWAGVGLVFVGLTMDVYAAWRRESMGGKAGWAGWFGWNRESVVNGGLMLSDVQRLKLVDTEDERQVLLKDSS